MKFRKGEAEIELLDPNTFNIPIRAGFEPVKETEEPDGQNGSIPDEAELAELKAKAKELGIRNAHSMGKEKLLEKIAEAEKGA